MNEFESMADEGRQVLGVLLWDVKNIQEGELGLLSFTFVCLAVI